ncbi:zinc finger, CCHC-type containing protein [Tanacetum coccineum]
MDVSDIVEDDEEAFFKGSTQNVDDDEIVVLDIADQSKDYCEDVIWFTKSTSLDSSLDDDYFPLDQQDLEYRIIYDKSWDPNWMDEKNHGFWDTTLTDRIVWDPQQSIPKPKLLLDLQEEHMLFEVLDNKGGEHLQLHAGAMITTPSADSAGGHGVKDELFLCTKNFSGEMKPKKKDDLEQGLLNKKLKILNDRDEYCEAALKEQGTPLKKLGKERQQASCKKLGHKSFLALRYCEERPLLLGNPGMGAGLCTYYQKVSGGDQSGPHLGSQSCLETNMYRAPVYPHKWRLRNKGHRLQEDESCIKKLGKERQQASCKNTKKNTVLCGCRKAGQNSEEERSSLKAKVLKARRGPSSSIIPKKATPSTSLVSDRLATSDTETINRSSVKLVRREEQEKVAELRRFEEAIKRERLEEMQQREKKEEEIEYDNWAGGLVLTTLQLQLLSVAEVEEDSLTKKKLQLLEVPRPTNGRRQQNKGKKDHGSGDFWPNSAQNNNKFWEEDHEEQTPRENMVRSYYEEEQLRREEQELDCLKRLPGIKRITKKEAPPMDLATLKEKARKLDYKNGKDFRHDMCQITVSAHIYISSRQQKFLVLRFFDVKEQQGIDWKKDFEFLDCPGPRQGVEDLREQMVKRMASMNTRLNIEKLDGNIVQKHGGSKQVGFKQLGHGVETGVHGVHDEKCVWFEVELHGAQEDREAEIFQGYISRIEDTTMSTYLVNRSPPSAIGFKTLVDMLGFFGWLAIKQGMLEPVKVKCIFLGYRKGILGNKLWRLDDVTSKVVLYRNMSFNESGEYKETFIGSGVAWELFSYREDSNEAAFAGAAVDKVYAHESLTFNYAVAREVISKWKARLKDDIDARSDVYVLSNGCRRRSDDTRDQSGNTLRVSQSGFYNRKLLQTLLKGHSILSLEGSISDECDVEKNDKWSCIYAVGSQEYQMVCTRLDIAFADVGMLNKFDRGLQTDVQVFVDFYYAMGRSITKYGLMIQGCAGS